MSNASKPTIALSILGGTIVFFCALHALTQNHTEGLLAWSIAGVFAAIFIGVALWLSGREAKGPLYLFVVGTAISFLIMVNIEDKDSIFQGKILQEVNVADPSSKLTIPLLNWFGTRDVFKGLCR
ncbi:hypothetical protein [Lewinella sp. 4G2]|uniref:hypothetical protein n=1 Tax=Lewinella sp. 4G2 TaxID=1803372 RepID=UPI0007B46247|nr:hypothetical protein [Lewinella sp. 4G2]OAV43917.1 hypothetical protein A3850_005155 [Lewinella sp. 4G2]